MSRGAMTDITAASTHDDQKTPRTVVLASSAGTAFEWYDFVFASLTTVMAQHFYAEVGESTAYILALLTFGVGFVVRPLGAAVFGWFGDPRAARRPSSSPFRHGRCHRRHRPAARLRPDRAWRRPILLILMRMAQGFALGGEYGGAAIYVAEHAPNHSRGLRPAGSRPPPPSA